MTFYSVEDIQEKEETVPTQKIETEIEDQSQYAVLGIIIAAGIGAAIFYLKGYKPKH